MTNQGREHYSRDEPAGELFQAIRSGDISQVRAMLDASPSLVDAQASYAHEQVRAMYTVVLAGPAIKSLEHIGRTLALIKLLLECGAYLEDLTSTDLDAPP